jgi:hypothetical protein
LALNQPDLATPAPTRRLIRKKPLYEMKVAVFFQAIEEGLILNLTKQGLAIVTKTIFTPGKKLNVSFLVPDVLTGEQIPIFAKCLVMWSRDLENRGYLTGMKILLMDSEDAGYLCAFVDSLPEVQT